MNIPLLAVLIALAPAASAGPQEARWAPVLQALASPRGATTFSGVSLNGVEAPGLLARLSAVDWRSAQGQELARPALDKLAAQGVVPTQPDAPERALDALAAVAAGLRDRAAALTRAEDPGEERLEEFGRGLDELSRSAAFLTPALADEVLTQARAVRSRIERLWEQRAAKALAAADGLWPAAEPAVEASDEPQRALVRLSRPSGLRLKAAAGYPEWARGSDGTFLDLELPHLRQDQFGDAFRAMDLALARADFPVEVRTAAHQFLIAATGYFESEAAGRPRLGELLWKLDGDRVLALVHRDLMADAAEVGRIVERLDAYRFVNDPPLKDQLKKLGGTIWINQSDRGVSLWIELRKGGAVARRRGLEPLQLADGFAALPLKIRAVNEKDRAFARARKAALTGLDKARVEAARLFLDRAVRFAKEEARERGERVSLQWRRVPGFLELAVRREADHSMAGFSKGSPMRAWHENRWKESLKAEPGLMPRLAALGAEVVADSGDATAEPNARRIILRIPL